MIESAYLVIGLYAYPTDELVGTFAYYDKIDKMIFMHDRHKLGYNTRPSSDTVIVLTGPISIWRNSSRALEVIESMIDDVGKFILLCPSVFEKDELRKELSKVGVSVLNKYNNAQVLFYSVDGIAPPNFCALIDIPDDVVVKREDAAQRKYGKIQNIPFRKREEYYELIRSE